MGCNTNKIRMGRSQRNAFTLVELLVVISIIALLISILLPSLKNARDQAKAVKCAANQAGIVKASLTYQAEENEWIPGSPGTTGSMLLGPYAGRSPDDEKIPAPPVQIWDFAGPLAAVQMGRASVDPNRAERWRQLITDIFECPSNKFESEPYFGSQVGPHGNFGIQKMVSYNTIRNFLLWPKESIGGQQGPYPSYSGWDANIGSSSQVLLSRNWVPRAERIGQPSEKIFISDGSRFTDDDGVIDHDISWNGKSGGGFSDGGPTLDEQYLRSFHLEDPSRRYTYRHGRGRNEVGLVASFFDGHAERMSEKRTRFPDFWFPKGTTMAISDMNPDTYLPLFDIMSQHPQYLYEVKR